MLYMKHTRSGWLGETMRRTYIRPSLESEDETDACTLLLRREGTRDQAEAERGSKGGGETARSQGRKNRQEFLQPSGRGWFLVDLNRSERGEIKTMGCISPRNMLHL